MSSGALARHPAGPSPTVVAVARAWTPPPRRKTKRMAGPTLSTCPTRAAPRCPRPPTVSRELRSAVGSHLGLRGRGNAPFWSVGRGHAFSWLLGHGDVSPWGVARTDAFPPAGAPAHEVPVVSDPEASGPERAGRGRASSRDTSPPAEDRGWSARAGSGPEAVGCGGAPTISRCRGHVKRSRRGQRQPMRGELRHIRPVGGPVAESVPPPGIAVTRYAHRRHPQSPVARRRLQKNPSRRTRRRRRSRRTDARWTHRGRLTRCRRGTGHFPSATRRDEAVKAVKGGGGAAAIAAVRR